MRIDTKCELGKCYHFFNTDKKGPFFGKCVGIHPNVYIYGNNSVYNVFDCDDDFEGGYDDECFENLAECCLFVKDHPEYGTTD